MTAFIAPTSLETQFSGQYGNAAVAHGAYSPAAPAVNDTVILLKLYAGTKITGADLNTGANGAGTLLDVGFQYTDGTAGGVANQLFSGVNTAAAARGRSLTRPFTLTKDAYVVGTFKGAVGAVASAANYIDVIVEFEFRGA